MDVLLQVPRPTRSGSGVRWIDANGIAPAGLLLRPRRWRIFTRSKLRYRAAPKELFHARDWYAYRSRTAGATHALSPAK